MTILPLPALIGALAVSTTTYAAVDAGMIIAAANDFLARHSADLEQQYGNSVRIETSVDRVDNRLQMADCDQPIAATLKSTRTIGRINIQVSCEGANRWTLYVPAEVKLFRPVVVLAGPVARGTALSADDLELRDMDISRLNGSYFTDPGEVVGLVARRLLAADRPLTAAWLKPPIVVHKGDAVILTATGGGLTVKMPGIALADGETGQQISVRNAQSNRVVEAEVTGPGQVQVPM